MILKSEVHDLSGAQAFSFDASFDVSLQSVDLSNAMISKNALILTYYFSCYCYCYYSIFNDILFIISEGRYTHR